MGLKHVGMRWEKRLREIEQLRQKFKGNPYRVPFPDYRSDRTPTPCSNMVGGNGFRKNGLPAGARSFPVGNLHKQGPQLVTPGAIEAGELKHFGGKKP